MDEVFVRIYRFFQRRKVLLFLVLGIWIGLCAWQISNIRFEENISGALPDDPKMKKISETLEHSPFLERIYLVLTYTDSTYKDSLDLSVVADSLQVRLTDTSQVMFKEVRTKLNEESTMALLDLVYNNLPYFLDSADYASVDSSLTDAKIASMMDRGYKLLLSPAGIVTKKFFTRDPSGLAWKGLKKLEKLNISDNFKIKDGYIFTKDDQNLIVFIQPAHKAGNTGKNKPMIKALDEKIAALKSEFKGLDVKYFGAPAVSVANARQVREDVLLTVGLALVVLTLMLTLYYRNLYAVPLLLLPPAFGAMTGIASLILFKGVVSPISLGIGSVMLGVILDFSIHAYTHHREKKDVAATIKDISVLLLATSGTTILAFMSLLVLSSSLLNDLGIFASVSVGSATLFTLIIFPHFLPKAKEKKPLFNVQKIVPKGFKIPASVIMLGFAGIMAAVFVYIPRTGFEADMDKLSYMTPELKNAEEYLDKISNFKLKNVYLVSEGKDLEEALEKNKKYIPILEDLRQDSVIKGYTSVNTAWPAASVREAKMAQWKKFWTPEKISYFKAQVESNADRLGFKAGTFDVVFAWLQEPPVYTPEQAQEILKPLFFNDLVEYSDNGVKIINVLRVKEENKPQVYEKFEEEDLVFDNKSLFNSLVNILQKDFNLLAWLSISLVLVVVWLTFKRTAFTITTMVPMISSWLLTLGLMGFFGLKFNIFNIVICTFIFGLGIDYSIFLGRGILDDFRLRNNNLRSYKISVTLSLLTTLLGVGVLIFARHPALRSISLISLISLFSVAFISFTVQPVLFRFFIGKNNQPRRQPLSFWVFFCTIFVGMYTIMVCAFMAFCGKLLIDWKWIKGGRKRFGKIVSFFARSIIYIAFPMRKSVSLDYAKAKTPGIIVANHQSYVDLLFVYMLSGNIKVITKERIFRLPLLGTIVRCLGNYTPEESMQPEFPETVKKDFSEGYSVLFFPEGTRTSDFTIGRFKKGAFWLAEELKADILPLVIHGTGTCVRKGSSWIGPSNLSATTFEKIAWNDPSYGKDYTEKSKNICRMMRKELEKIREKIDTKKFTRETLLPIYIYRRVNVRRAYKQMLHRWEQINALDKKLKNENHLVFTDANFGELIAFLHFKNGNRKFTVIETNPDKIAELEALRFWVPHLVIASDLSAVPPEFRRVTHDIYAEA